MFEPVRGGCMPLRTTALFGEVPAKAVPAEYKEEP